MRVLVQCVCVCVCVCVLQSTVCLAGQCVFCNVSLQLVVSAAHLPFNSLALDASLARKCTHRGRGKIALSANAAGEQPTVRDVGTGQN